ncbi:MAG: hypothetical protein P8130_12905 [Deltaproteobacteria bacterium]
MFDPASPYKEPFSQFKIKFDEENMKKFGLAKPSGYIAMFDEVALKTTVLMRLIRNRYGFWSPIL